MEGFREHTPTFIEFQKEIRKLVEDVNKTLRDNSLIPPCNPFWLKEDFFPEGRIDLEGLKEPHIEIKRPRM